MSQLWDVRFNEGGRYPSNSGVAVNSLVVNLSHRGSDLFIFSILSPVTLFSAYQCTWNFVPSVEGFHEITDMCIWEVIFVIENQCWQEADKAYSSQHSFEPSTLRGKLCVADIWGEWGLSSLHENIQKSVTGPSTPLLCDFLYHIPICDLLPYLSLHFPYT